MCKPSYTPNEAAKATGLDPSHIDAAIRSGDLEAHKIGFQVVILRGSLTKWIRKQPLLLEVTGNG